MNEVQYQCLVMKIVKNVAGSDVSLSNKKASCNWFFRVVFTCIHLEYKKGIRVPLTHPGTFSSNNETHMHTPSVPILTLILCAFFSIIFIVIRNSLWNETFLKTKKAIIKKLDPLNVLFRLVGIEKGTSTSTQFFGLNCYTTKNRIFNTTEANKKGWHNNKNTRNSNNDSTKSFWERILIHY
jgi:hypothetical protein